MPVKWNTKKFGLRKARQRQTVLQTLIRLYYRRAGFPGSFIYTGI